jgi:hypothetical protein
MSLLGLALLSSLLYWQGITAQYPLAHGIRTPRASWPQLVDFSRWAALQHAVVYALLIGCYMLALRLTLRLNVAHTRISIVVIVGGWLMSGVVLLGAYPGESLDVFDYLFRGRMLVRLGASPLAVTPDAFPSHAFYRYVSWKGWVDTYGPIWEYASGATAWLVGESGRMVLVRYIVGYRLLALSLTLVCGVLIALIVRQTVPFHVPTALTAWLWNPLVLISTGVGAHNDVLMLVFVLLALLLFQRHRWLLGWLALALAAHVKLTALLLLPVLGLWLVQRRGWWRAVAISSAAALIALPLSWLLYQPLGGWATLPRMLRERTILIYNSPGNIAYHELQTRWHWPEIDARPVVTLSSTLLFFVVAALLLVWQWRRRPTEALLWRSALVITLAYLLVGSYWFQSWYILWAIVLATLLPMSRWALTLLPLYSLGGLWSNLVTDFANQDPAQLLTSTQIAWLMVGTLLVPMLCAVVLPSCWQLIRAAIAPWLPHEPVITP